MAHRGRCLVAGQAATSTRKRSLACRAEAGEVILPDGGASPAIQELARLLRVKNPEESMLRLSEVMERSTELFRNSPDFAIPEVRFSQIEDGRFPYYVTRQLNRRGVVVVRGAVPADTAIRWRDELMEYLEVNGLNDGSRGMKDVFWSKAQAHAREHQGVREVLSALNRLWKPDARSPVDLTKSLSYCDRAFVGNPTSSGLLAEHTAVMAGGPSASQRWLNPHHREAYREIFNGRWEEWDPFKAGPRIRAAESPGLDVDGGDDASGAPQAFRPFQGYLSFGRWGELGNVHVVPMMRVATAYMLLRPFMSDVMGVGDHEKDWLCGAGNGPELALSSKWHQPVLDALVRLPPLSAGDAIFWHSDIVHCEASALPRAVIASERAAISASFASPRQAAGNIPQTPSAIPFVAAAGAGGGGGGRGDSDGVRAGAAVTRSGGERGDEDGIKRVDPSTFAGIHLASLPVCEANAKYIRAQGKAFADGTRPSGAVKIVMDEEMVEEGRFVGRVLKENLTRAGMQGMGLRRFRKEHSNPALESHHRVLDLAYEW